MDMPKVVIFGMNEVAMPRNGLRLWEIYSNLAPRQARTDARRNHSPLLKATPSEPLSASTVWGISGEKIGEGEQEDER